MARKIHHTDEFVSSCLWFDDDNLVHYQQSLPKKLKEKYDLLTKYVKLWKPGDRISYEDIQIRTGIIMDDNGKALLRKVLRDNNIAWLCYRGQGIELAYEGNAAKIADRRFRYGDLYNHSANRVHNLVHDYVRESGNVRNIRIHEEHLEAIEEADNVLGAVREYKATLDYGQQTLNNDSDEDGMASAPVV
jgi:hypothetical protein